MPIPPVTYRASSLEATLQRSIVSGIGKAASISGKIGREIKFRFSALVSCATGTSFLVNNETRVPTFSFMSSPPKQVFCPIPPVTKGALSLDAYFKTFFK